MFGATVAVPGSRAVLAGIAAAVVVCGLLLISLAGAPFIMLGARAGGAAFALFGIRFDVGIAGLKSVNFFDWDGALEEAFDILEQAAFIRADERARATFLAGATGASDAVDVVFRHVREFEIYHVWQEGDVDTAGCDVGGHEYSGFAGFEFGECSSASALAFISVNGVGGDAVLSELFCQFVGTVFGARENEDLGPVAGAHEV